MRQVSSGPSAVAKQVSERTRGGIADRLSPVQLVCVSAASKMVASTATYPHEVIRSYMHIQVCPTLAHAIALSPSFSESLCTLDQTAFERPCTPLLAAPHAEPFCSLEHRRMRMGWSHPVSEDAQHPFQLAAHPLHGKT